MANDITNTSFAEEWLNQAEWRRGKAEEHPDDRRNTDAAELWEKLAASANVTGGVSWLVLRKYNEISEDDDKASKLMEAQTAAYQNVGFHIFPETPDELLTDILKDAGFRLPTIVPPTPRGSSPLK